MHPLININQFTAKSHYESKPRETCTLIRNQLTETKHNHTVLTLDCQNIKQVRRTSAKFIQCSVQQNLSCIHPSIHPSVNPDISPSIPTSRHTNMEFSCHNNCLNISFGKLLFRVFTLEPAVRKVVLWQGS